MKLRDKKSNDGSPVSIFCTAILIFLSKNYGRFIIAYIKRFAQRFYIFRLVLRICLGIFGGLSPFSLLAEFTATDSDNLFIIKENTNGFVSDLGSIRVSTAGVYNSMNSVVNNLVDIKSGLGYSGGYDTLKFDLQTVRNYQAANGTLLAAIMKGLGSQSQTTWYGETIGEKLDRIITALESLEDSGGSGSETPETPEIPSDIATETTLAAFKGKYEEISDKILNSFGFSDTSDNVPSSFYDLLLNKYYRGRNFRYYEFNNNEAEGAAKVPFPNSSFTWLNEYSDYVNDVQSSRYAYSFPELINYPIVLQVAELERGLILLSKKQAWNDWQAHTNMVAQIVNQVDRIVLPPEDGRNDSVFNSETGTIETPSYGSSSAETVDIKPSYTNDFVQIEQSSETVTNSFDFLKSDEIKNRYISENMLNMGEFRDYGSVGSGFSGVWKIGDFVIDFSNSNTYYREIISTNTLSTVRTSMSYIWTFCAILAAFWFVVKIGGLNQD